MSWSACAIRGSTAKQESVWSSNVASGELLASNDAVAAAIYDLDPLTSAGSWAAGRTE